MNQSSEAVHLLIRLLSQYSPSGEEHDAQEYVYNLLVENGFENVRKDSVGNVIGEKGDGDKTLLFCSHIDIVPGWISVRLESGEVWGRGAVDAKSPLLAMIVAASGYESRSLRLVFSSVVGEESDSKGVRRLLEEMPPPDYVLIGEPTGMRAAAIAYRGGATVRIHVSTRGGHSSSPLDDSNAIIQLMRLVNYLSNRFAFSRDDFSNISVSITMVKGGHGDSRIPEDCEASLNIRYPPSIPFEKLSAIFSSAVSEYLEKNPSVLSIKHEFQDHVDGYASKRDQKMIEAARRAVKTTLGKDLLLIRKLGTSDFNYVGLKWGRPQLAWGPGNPSLAHSLEERISVEEFNAGIMMYGLFLQNLSSILSG
ncbi:MAG: M20/M25/M40 family metallo-hydrolase [Thermoproteota archaeon]